MFMSDDHEASDQSSPPRNPLVSMRIGASGMETRRKGRTMTTARASRSEKLMPSESFAPTTAKRSAPVFRFGVAAPSLPVTTGGGGAEGGVRIALV